MLLDIIASRHSRRVVLTHRVMPSRVVSPHVSLCQSCRHRCIVAASPHLSLCCRLSRYIIAALSSPIAPLFLVGCCVCPLSYSPLPALRCIVSPHASRRCRLAPPVALLRRIVLTRRIVAVSCIASCPLTVSPLPSLALHPFVSPHTSLRRPCRRHRVASSPPCLTCPSLSS